ncbi:MAG: hypothetical protein MJE12_22505 [Alphaproteobacteria bacterium]|nr:hypothetical protein [Alphaproteobacteria bacterium]
MTDLSLSVFGGFVVRDPVGADISLPTRKTRALLGYLAVNADQPQPRERLAALLWSDRSDQQARHSLNQALASIRRLGGEADIELLDGGSEHVMLRTEAVDADVVRFRALIDNAPGEAAALYAGPLLDGLMVRDPAFDEWLESARRSFHELACAALERVANDGVRGGAIEPAIDAAKRLVGLEPLHEEGHRLLMRLFQMSGDRAAALRQYQSCSEVLGRDLQVEPSRETRLLYDEIRQEDPESQATPAAVSVAATTDADRNAGLAMPDRPSIAVLPFANLSGDPEQEYFADGMAEDIIVGLSRFRWLFVIARNSSFTFKGQAVDVKQIGRELGVRYVLDGSVRRASDRVRVAAQLNGTANGAQIWAERFDRVLEDIFAVQDEITDSIVAAIEPELGQAEQRRAYQKKPEVLDAWDVYQRGAWHLYKRTKDDLEEAEDLFERALALDPTMTSALAGLVDAYYYQIVLGLTDDRAGRREKAIVAARRAVELDANDAAAHCAVGKARIMRQEHDAAVPELELALELNPSLAWSHYGLGAAAVFTGRSAEDAVEHIRHAIRLSPRDLHMGSFMVRLADAYLASGDYEAAVEWGRKSLRQPCFQWSRYAVIVSALGHLGELEEARKVLDELLPLRPDFSISMVRVTHLYTENASFDHYLEGLVKVGVAE